MTGSAELIWSRGMERLRSSDWQMLVRRRIVL
jgi:hypothetical protein